MSYMWLKKASKVGISAGLVTALGWGSIGLWISNIPLEAFTLASIRFIFSSVFLLAIALPLFRNKRGLFDSKKIFQSAICGTILFFQFVVTIYSYQLLSIGQATLLTNLHLLFIILFYFQKLRKVVFQIFLTSLILVGGIYLIFYQGASWTYTGILFGVGSSLFFAAYTFCVERFFPNNTEQYQAPIFFTGAILSLLFIGLDFDSLKALNSTNWINLAILLLISTLLAHFAYLIAIKKSGGLVAGTLSYFAIIFGFIFEGFYIESLSLKEITGVIVVFISLCYLLFVFETKRVATR